MKYVNTSEDMVTIEFKSYPSKEVQPGAIVNLSDNKYNNLKDKELKKKGFKLIKGSEYKKFMQSPEYVDLVKKRKKPAKLSKIESKKLKNK